MRILYLGDNHGTSRHRADALRRIGHDVTVLDPAKLLPGGPKGRHLARKMGGLMTQAFIERKVLAEAGKARHDVTWVNGGYFIGPSLVRRLRQSGPVINYNNDDPLGGRDRS